MRDWLTHLPWMTRQSWTSPYPAHRGLGFYPSSRHAAPPRVVVVHSTETLGFPSYNGGAAAPHFTINLVTGEVRQHVPLSWGSRCLAVRAGGVRDVTVNVSGVIQIEVIGAVTPGYPARYGHYDIPGRYPKDKRAQGYMARLLRAIHDETGIPLETSGYARWVPYPASYGARAAQRLTSFQYRDARGVLGHQHAPANDHGDGLLGRAVSGRAVDLEATLALARGGTTGPDPEPAPDPRGGFDADHLAYVSRVLTSLGFTDGDVWARTLAYQKAAGLDPEDGLPGPQTTTALEDDMEKLDTLLAEVRALRREVAAVPLAVWRFTNDAVTGQDAYWHLRAGAVDNPLHRGYPADPGSPVDLIRKVAEAVLTDAEADADAGSEEGSA